MLYKIIFHKKALWGLTVLFLVLSILVDTSLASSQSTGTALEQNGWAELCLSAEREALSRQRESQLIIF